MAASLPVVRPASLDPFFISLDTLYQRGLMAGASTYEQWAQTIPSSSKETRHGWLDKLPKLREWIGPREIQQLVAQEYTIRNKKFELTWTIPREDVEDDVMSVYGPSVEMGGMQAAEWPDDVMTPIVEGGDGSNPAIDAVTYDDANFFSPSHPIDTANPASPLQSNLYTTAGSGARLFTPANVAFIRAKFRQLKGRDGKPLGMNMTDVMIPPALEQDALQLANAEFIVANFGVNAATGSQSNVLKGTFNVIVNPKLTSDTEWYPMDTRFPIRPFVWQLRKAPEFAYRVSPTDPNVFDLDAYLYGVRARGNGGYGLWFMAMKCGA